MSEGYRTFDHTGDLGLEVWAETPERLYALAAIAVSAQVGEAEEPNAEVEVGVHRSAGDPEDLLVDFCNRALLEGEVHRALWTGARIERLTPVSLEGTLSGPRRDPRRQTFLREIKAVSFHDLELDLTPGRCRCRLILDV
jgi:SHS2 domain-containing protein